jgi:hypothetical protein
MSPLGGDERLRVPETDCSSGQGRPAAPSAAYSSLTTSWNAHAFFSSP